MSVLTIVNTDIIQLKTHIDNVENVLLHVLGVQMNISVQNVCGII
jgi:hypothetical protein